MYEQPPQAPPNLRIVHSVADEVGLDEDLNCPGSASLASVSIRRARPAAWQPHQSASTSDDIVAYWRRLRGTRRFPSRADLDVKTVAFYWPYSILFRVQDDGYVVEVDGTVNPQSSLGAGSLRSLRADGPLQFALTEWFVPVVRAAAHWGQPIDETTDLPIAGETARYRAVALPFSDDQIVVDTVLAHLASK